MVCWRGTFTFEKDAAPPPGAFPLGSKWGLLIESVRRLEVPLLRARLGKRLTRPVVRSGGLCVGKLEDLALNAQETRLYAAIDGTKTGEDLLKAQDASLALRVLYLLTELGHVSFAELEEQEAATPPAAAPSNPVPAAAPKPVSAAAPPPSGPPVRELPKSAREVGRAPPPATKAAPAPKAAPPVLQPTAQKPAAPVISRPPPTFAQPPPGELPDAAVKRLGALWERLSEGDHYAALGLERKSASAAEVKRNFFVLAKELHPDTVSDPALASLREAKERLFARINEASQVLGDDKRRKEYDEELDGKANSVDVSRIFAAEENFQRAEILIKARKYQEGLDLLEEAIQMNGEEAEFYAWRGYAR